MGYLRVVSSSSSSSTGSGKMSDTLRGMFKTSATPATVELSEEELEERRARQRAAAQERLGSWDKKLAQKNSGKSNSLAVPITAPEADLKAQQEQQATHEATQRAIDLSKRSEKKIESQLGYSPFQPHMSFSSNTAAAATAAAPPPVTTVGTSSSNSGTTTRLPPAPPVQRGQSGDGATSSTSGSSSSTGNVEVLQEQQQQQEPTLCQAPRLVLPLVLVRVLLILRGGR
mmetsp:Transcript_4318/g.6980  ORF Transcript_4318/g.6980 Transcript_4318/m.6980 type:complete len:229 (-) Transcript_4318:533-1219(-)